MTSEAATPTPRGRYPGKAVRRGEGPQPHGPTPEDVQLTPMQAIFLPITGWLQGDGEEEPVYGEPQIKGGFVWFWSCPPERGQEDVRELHGIRLTTLRRGGRIPDPVEVNGGATPEDVQLEAEGHRAAEIADDLRGEAA